MPHIAATELESDDQYLTCTITVTVMSTNITHSTGGSYILMQTEAFGSVS